ncbi:methionine aminotransferase [Tenacibaculum sp.]|nr:methionine aminotransferase [Tenacibaculum sp.]
MSKLPNTPTSIFSIISQLAIKYNAINLSQGFPNFPVDKRLLQISKRLIDENVHQYTPMAGLPSLLEKIALLTMNNYDRKVSPSSEILITTGATQGIYTVINTLVNYNDEVIILDPSYDSYEPSVLVAGGKPIHVALNDDYSPNFNRIESVITAKTKLIIINNPHNPTGRIWKESEFEALENLLEKHTHISLLSDEVYEYISFSHSHISINARSKIRNRAIIVSSFGKSLHVTGWKIGYLIAPEYLMKEIKKVHQFLVFSINSLSQHIISEYLDIVDFDEIKKMYLNKRMLFQGLLTRSKFQLLPCEGTYFQLANYNQISNKSDMDFAKELIEVHGVAAIPISVFNEDKRDNKILRFCFAKTDETLITAGNKLREI